MSRVLSDSVKGGSEDVSPGMGYRGKDIRVVGLFFLCVTGVELVTLSEPKQSSDEWTILRRWDVPWEWQTVMLTMVGCGVR